MTQRLSSVAQALRVLDVLRDRDVAGVSEIAAELGVGTSTVHRILTTLADADYARQVSSGRKYRLGPAMQGSTEGQAIDHCTEVALPHMERLRDETGETVHVAVLLRSNVKFIAAVESQQPMRVTNRAGRLLPANATAAGKVLLSLLPDEQVTKLLSGRLPAPTRRTCAEVAALRREIERTRADGYGRNFSEAELGVAAIAVPIRRRAGRTLAALTLTGPEARFNPDQEPRPSPTERRLVSLLAACAKSIEKDLAY